MARCTGARPDLFSSEATAAFHITRSSLVRVQLHYLIKETAPVHERNHANAFVESVSAGPFCIVEHARQAIGRNAAGIEKAAVGRTGSHGRYDGDAGP